MRSLLQVLIHYDYSVCDLYILIETLTRLEASSRLHLGVLLTNLVPMILTDVRNGTLNIRNLALCNISRIPKD